MTSVEHTDVLEELKEIRRRLEALEDAILSPDDEVALEQARKEFSIILRLSPRLK